MHLSKHSKKLSILQNKRLVLPIIVFFLIWTVPDILNQVNGGLDPSWILAIHLAKLTEFTWGSEIVWTYGPLGYLLHPINVDAYLWSHVVIYKIISHILFFTIIGFFSYKTKFPVITALSFGFLSIFLTDRAITYYPIIGILLGYFLYIEYCKKWILIIPLSIATSFLFFTKGDLGFGSLSILVLSCIVLLTRRRVKEVIVCISTYFSSLLLMWSAMNYPLEKFAEYFENTLSLISGYTVAMSLEAPINFISFAIVGWILYFLIIIDSIKKDRKNLTIIFISSGILFSFFRLGFVREGHVTFYFILWATIMLIFLFSNTKTKIRINSTLKYSIIAIVIIFVLTSNLALVVKFSPRDSSEGLNREKFLELYSHFLFNPFTKLEIQKYPTYMEYFTYDEKFESQRISEKLALKNQYPIISEDTLETIDDQKVDVIPFDVALLYAYDLNWYPRPILGSYNAYNSHLDEIDASFFKQESSPQFLIYKFRSIDGRYPGFDEPLTSQTILCNYHGVQKIANGFHLLEKNSKNICFEEKKLYSINADFGEKILVPESEDGFIIGKIKIEQNLLGKLSDILYKSPKVYFQINENEKKFRFLYPTAVNGLILSTDHSIETHPIIKDNINSFIIDTDFRNYFEEIEIEFFEIKINS